MAANQISTLPVVVIVLHNQCNCPAYGTLGLDSVRPGKQLAGQQGEDSSCHTECRSPSLDRVRDLSYTNSGVVVHTMSQKITKT
jgi:hypothetical protein